MTNEVAGYARPLPNGQFWAMVRLHRDGRPKPVLGDGGSPVVYPDEASALREVVKHICGYFNSPMVRDGVKAQRNAAADALFSLKPIRRKGKVVEVESRRAKG
jgi:hypothetical protein